MFKTFRNFNKLTKIIAILLISILSFQLVSAISVHGTVYDLNLNKVENAVLEIDTSPKQQLIAKDGTYKFTVNPGNYTIKASSYNGRIIKLVARENISVIQEGDYVLDIILFPNFQEEEEIINNSSDINISSVDLEKTEDNFYLISFVAVLLLLIASVFFYFKLTSDSVKISRTNSRSKRTIKKTKKSFEKLKGENTNKNKNTDENIEEYADSEEYKESLKTKSKPSKEFKEKSNKNDLNYSADQDLESLLEFIKKQDGRTTQKDIRRNFPHSEAKISLMIAELEDKEIVKKVKKGRGNIIILRNKD